jgi:hypothetical protein
MTTFNSFLSIGRQVADSTAIGRCGHPAAATTSLLAPAQDTLLLNAEAVDTEAHDVARL